MLDQKLRIIKENTHDDKYVKEITGCLMLCFDRFAP